MDHIWNYKHSSFPRNIQDLLSIMLINRGIANDYVTPPRPSELVTQVINPDFIKEFAHMILKHSSGQILIYGDYDADGIISTSILVSLLNDFGIKSIAYIPDRRLDGYGINHKSLSRILDQNPKISMLITADNGISGYEAINYARQCNVDTIIIDHHHIPIELPPANLIIHSTQSSASTLCWLISSYLQSPQSLGLASIGMIADVTPLVGINRSIAYHGLEEIKTTQHLGLDTLISVSQIDKKSLDIGHISFQIAPRINATGRISSGKIAFDLLNSTQSTNALALAQQINQLNTSRQQLTENTLATVMNEDYSDTNLIISVSQSYDEGIIGLVASKLVEKFHKPAIVISQGEKLSKASVRSLSVINIIEFLKASSTRYYSIGGHAQASGFSILNDQLEKLIEELHLASKSWSNLDFRPVINIDSVLDTRIVNFELINMIDTLAPFGVGNPKPVFSSTGHIIKLLYIGNQKQHLSGQISINNQIFRFVHFNYNREIPINTKIEIAYQLQVNDWQNCKSIEMNMLNWRVV